MVEEGLRFLAGTDAEILGLGWNVDYRPVVAGPWIGVPSANLGLNLLASSAHWSTPRVYLPVALDGQASSR
jgi:hypothetical protein